MQVCMLNASCKPNDVGGKPGLNIHASNSALLDCTIYPVSPSPGGSGGDRSIWDDD